MGVIYKITNTVNGKAYIGQTSATLHRRWNEHKADARNRKAHPYLHLAMLKHGYDNFTIEVVDQAETREELDAKEIEWIAKLRTTDKHHGYNCTTGGGACFHGPSSRARIKGVKRSPESKAKRSETMKGRDISLSPERKEALRLSRVGYKASPETIEKMKVMQNHIWTPERREMWSVKMREVASRRKSLSQGVNPNHSAAMKRIWQERRENGEAKRIVSKRDAAVKAYWNNPSSRERVKNMWTDEKREEYRNKSLAFFSSPEGIAARSVMSEKSRQRQSIRVMSEEDRKRASDSVRMGWVNRRRRAKEAA